MICYYCGSLAIKQLKNKKFICSEKINQCSFIINKMKIKREKTNLEKYGVPNPSMTIETKKKISNIHKNKSSQEKKNINSKRKQTNLERYGVEYTINNSNIRLKTEKTCKLRYNSKSPFDSKDIQDKIKLNVLKNYGENNISKLEFIKEKIINTKISRGYITKFNDNKKNYYQQVYKFSEKSYKDYYSIINPLNLKRGLEYHLDHIYSIHDGYRYNIPPEIIGNFNNLRIIKSTENLIKSRNSDITIIELLYLYHIS